MEMIRKYKNFILPLLVASCCVLGTLGQGMKTKNTPAVVSTEVATTKPTTKPTAEPTVEPTTEPTKGPSKEECASDIQLWAIQSKNVMTSIGIAVDYMAAKDLLNYGIYTLEAKNAYEKIIVPQCDSDVQVAHDLIGITIKHMGKAFSAMKDGRTDDAANEFTQASESIRLAGNIVNDIGRKYEIK